MVGHNKLDCCCCGGCIVAVLDSSLGNSWIPCILLGEGSSRDGLTSVGAMRDTVGEEVGVDIGVESEVVEWAVRFLKDIVYMLLLPFLLLGCRMRLKRLCSLLP